MKMYLRLGETPIIIFLVLQGLDGMLSYLGLRGSGWAGVVEGNPLVAHTMEVIGVVPALYAWKIMGSLSGIFIYLKGERFGRITLLVLIAIYARYSVLVWLWILVETAPR